MECYPGVTAIWAYERSRMQFVDFFQFFLELSNCRIWILAVWQKKVAGTGNLANFFIHMSFWQSVEFSHCNIIQPLSICLKILPNIFFLNLFMFLCRLLYVFPSPVHFGRIRPPAIIKLSF